MQTGGADSGVDAKEEAYGGGHDHGENRNISSGNCSEGLVAQRHAVQNS